MADASEIQDKPRYSVRILLQYLGLAIIIYLAEEIGRLAGLPGGLKVSPIWPASGIALASLLLLGWNVWPGIFLGFLVYNFLHLALSFSSLHGIVIGLILSTASLLQAFLGAYFIRRFSSTEFYLSLRSTLLFLAIAILTCVTAPTIAIPILYLLGDIPKEIVLFSWITFWTGDTIGVLLFTPLIISFILPSPIKYTRKKKIEAFILFLLLVLASIGIFFEKYSIHIWLLPFLLWATLRLNIRGLTIALVIISVFAVAATTLGYGPYYNIDVNKSLFYLASFIGTITATMLILTSIINENAESAKLLQEYNLKLKNAVNTSTHQLQEAKDEIIVREKLTSLAVLASGISHEIKDPLLNINHYTTAAQDCCKNIQEAFEVSESVVPNDIKDFVKMNFNALKDCLIKIEDHDKRAQEIVNIILHRSKGELEHATGFKTVNIHNILNGCCNKAIREFESRTPYALHVIKEYDIDIKPIEAIILDLSRAFTSIIDNSVYALKQKAAHHLESFELTLTIRTFNKGHFIEISIEDNGIGMPEAVQKRLFQPFFSTKPLGEGTGLGLALVHDIIVQEHHGSISVASEKDRFTKITISLPKSHITDVWKE